MLSTSLWPVAPGMCATKSPFLSQRKGRWLRKLLLQNNLVGLKFWNPGFLTTVLDPKLCRDPGWMWDQISLTGWSSIDLTCKLDLFMRMSSFKKYLQLTGLNEVRLGVSPPLELDWNTNSTTKPAFSLVKEGVLASSCLSAVGSNQVEASGCPGVWLRKLDDSRA